MEKDPKAETTETSHAVVARLTEEARRLKRLSELQALKGNPREVSVDAEDMISLVAEQAAQKNPPPLDPPPVQK